MLNSRIPFCLMKGLKKGGQPADADELRKRTVEPRFDANVIARFLCAHHQVEHVSQIMPFGNRVYGWDLCREVVMPLELVSLGGEGVDASAVVYAKGLANGQPSNPFMHPVRGTPMAVDLSRVCIYNLACRSYVNHTGCQLAVRSNVGNRHMDAIQETAQRDKVYEAAGGIAGAFAVLDPSPAGESKDMDDVSMVETPFGYQNGPFIRSMMLVNERNLTNGIMKLPYEVCRAAKLPVWHEDLFAPSEPIIKAALHAMQVPAAAMDVARAEYIKRYTEEQMAKGLKEDGTPVDRSLYFAAVPINHVLAWPLHSENYRQQRQCQVEELRFIHPDGRPVILYYLVPGEKYEKMLAEFKEAWLGRCDYRPLNEVGFQFIPIDPATRAPNYAARLPGEVRMRAHIKYAAAPLGLSPATLAALAPALDPAFPSCHHWSQVDMQQDAAIREFMHTSESSIHN